MTIRKVSFLLFTACASLHFFEATAVSSPGRDRQAPTAPTNLVVSGVTETTAQLSWGRSTDKQGIASYKIRLINRDNSSYSTIVTVSGSLTSYTATYLAPNSRYSISVFALDPQGNASQDSNVVTTQTAADETPPTTPALSAMAISPSQVLLTWSRSTDNLPLNCCTYAIFNNDARVTQFINWNGESATMVSATVRRLTPGTQYTFKVITSDFYQNAATSNPVTVTTETSTDSVAPEPPTDLHIVVEDNGGGELWLGWTQTTDNVDAQPFIEYEIYVNGVLSGLPVSAGISEDFVYTSQECLNTFVVRAVDRSGNVSQPSNPITYRRWVCD